MLVSALSVILALMMPEATGMKQHSSYSRSKKEKNYCRTQVKKSLEADRKKMKKTKNSGQC